MIPRNQRCRCYCSTASPSTLSVILAMCPNLGMLGIVRPQRPEGTITAASQESNPYSLHLLKGSAVKSLLLENCDLTATSLNTVQGLETVLTNKSLASLAQRCPQLKLLKIRNCPQLTVTALIEMTEHCKELTDLVFITRGNEDSAYVCYTPQSKLINALPEPPIFLN